MKKSILIAIIIVVVSAKLEVQRNIPQLCQIVVVGGSTGGLAAAIASARNAKNTCLLQPTDWPGGQLTSGGVSAIDFGWETIVNPKTGEQFVVSDWDARPENLPKDFYNIVMQQTQDSGDCWVSRVCYPPQKMLEKGIFPLIEELSEYLQVFYNTVPQSVEMKQNDSQIASLTAIQRTPQDSTPCNGYDKYISQDLDDWYSTQNSERFDKTIHIFDEATVYIDGSEWGELLSLSGAAYLQGIAENFDGDTGYASNPNSYQSDLQTCGQSFTYGIAQQYGDVKAAQLEGQISPLPVEHPEFYSFSGYTGDQIWTYRRLVSNGTQKYSYNKGDITLQNWGQGNDYQYGYIFLNHNDTRSQIQSKDWRGGVNQTTLRGAERMAIGWNYAFKNMANQTDQISFAKDVWGTCNNLTKYPYIRDTKRSVGIFDFVMKVSDISGTFPPLTGTVFDDRVALGYYSVDIHPLFNCSYPSYMTQTHPPLPYFIPFKALTNKKVTNLLVAGKTIAQSFLTNAATRLHPSEWSSGTAAGVAAALMRNFSLTETGFVLSYIKLLQFQISQLQPINWYLNNTYIPSTTASREDQTSPEVTNIE